MRIPRVALAAILLAPACNDESTAAAPTPISFAQDVQPIFATSCVGCHTGATAPPSARPMSLETGPAYANIVNVRAFETDTSTLLDRIEPGDPEVSYLVHKIQGTHTAGSVRGSGLRMPRTCPGTIPCLTAQQIQLIRQWVLEGAANN
jgi:mono/diheme cytochrome c family protein